MRFKYWWNDSERGQMKYAGGGGLFICHYSHHKYHKHWLGLNLGLRGRGTLTDTLSTT
jgi:hypothetical protein